MLHRQDEDKFQEPPWPEHSKMSCQECKTGLGDYVRHRSAGRQPFQEAIPIHLESCTGCTWAFLDLFDILMATRVMQLMDTWVTPERAPEQPILEGILALCQMEVGAAERVGDLKAAARGLAVIGIIRRLLNDKKEARLTHELGLRTAMEADDLWSMTVSHADSGRLAWSDKFVEDALDNFAKALNYANQLRDSEIKSRIERLANQVVDEISTNLSKAKRALSLLSGIPGETNEPVQTLKQAPHEAGVMAASPLKQPATFYDALIKPNFSFTTGGDKVVAINISQEIKMKIASGPELDFDGNVTVFITTDRSALEDLPEQFLIDLLFLPTNQVLCAIKVGPGERARLCSVAGLELRAKLPGFEDFLERYRRMLNQKGKKVRRFPRTALAFRIWW